MSAPPIIAVTMGDPAGIGPEIVLKALAVLGARPTPPRAVAVGTRTAFERAASALGETIHLLPVGEAAAWPAVELVESSIDEAPVTIGAPDAESGRQAYLAVAQAVAMAKDGHAAAIATAPISKDALNRAGHHYAGHTEMLADLTGVRDSRMMLAHGDLRVSHVTTHVPLARVPTLLTRERLSRTFDLTLAALHRLGFTRPRVAVAALNPHAGEGGMFGREDIDITAPVLAEYQALGHDISGPHPGDTVFVKAAAGQFDCVVAMYHDQGHIPVKLLGFRVDRATGRWTGLSGVNITLGLPMIRTSVDHGTALDIAGQGIANADSMVEAIDYAAMLAAGDAP